MLNTNKTNRVLSLSWRESHVPIGSVVCTVGNPGIAKQNNVVLVKAVLRAILACFADTVIEKLTDNFFVLYSRHQFFHGTNTMIFLCYRCYYNAKITTVNYHAHIILALFSQLSPLFLQRWWPTTYKISRLKVLDCVRCKLNTQYQNFIRGLCLFPIHNYYYLFGDL